MEECKTGATESGGRCGSKVAKVSVRVSSAVSHRIGCCDDDDDCASCEADEDDGAFLSAMGDDDEEEDDNEEEVDGELLSFLS